MSASRSSEGPTDSPPQYVVNLGGAKVARAAPQRTLFPNLSKFIKAFSETAFSNLPLGFRAFFAHSVELCFKKYPGSFPVPLRRERAAERVPRVPAGA